MIKILNNDQVRLADAATIANEPILSIDLMERAATACTEWILQRYPAGNSFLICCGKGNNGGDGLAIARQLWKRGKNITVCIAENTGNASADFSTNLMRWNELTGQQVIALHTAGDLPQTAPGTIIIDAFFGSGLNRDIDPQLGDIIKQLNGLPCNIISIDAPSGLYGDKPSTHRDHIIRASTTLSFQVPRPAFLYPEYEAFIGEFQLLDIRLNADYIEQAPAYGFILNDLDIAGLLPPRAIFGHKGNFGHALLLAGSYGKAGAAILAAGAALRSGAGLLTVRTPEKCVYPLQTALPEAMCLPDIHPECLQEIVPPGKYDAIGIGPGIGQDPQTANVLKRCLQDFDLPMVIDADALNILSQNPTWLNFLPAGTILTPHLREFERLAGKIADPFARTARQLELAKKYNCYILLKGKFSALACPDGQLFFNPTGNNGMAKGGSGDVLTGIITGLLAQGIGPMKAVLTGMYLHGLAGDLAAAEHTAYGMKAGDITDYLPSAFTEVLKSAL